MFEARSTQTKVKHIILEQYLKAWGGIIMYGAKKGILTVLQRGGSAGLHFVYVDCFAGHGRYAGELEDLQQGSPLIPVPGSPILGIQALDSLMEHGKKEGIPIRVNTILIEADKEAFSELLISLDVAGFANRTRETTDFHTLRAGEIAVVHGDSTVMTADLLAYTTANKYTYTFYFLDPRGPTGIPLDNVSQIICQDRHDTLINMPYQDLHKKSGILGKKEWSRVETTLLQNYDAMFGGTAWHSIVKAWMETTTDSRRSEELELDLANYYAGVLRGVDSGLSIKSLPLRFPDKERTMFHLYLTTHDPSGAIRMNQIILDAGYAEHHLRWHLQYLKMTHGGQQMGLFAPSEIAPPSKQPGRDYTDEIANKIAGAFSGTTTNQKKIYQLLADELYTPSEISKALSQLKKIGKASFDSSPSKLRHATPIKIL